MKKKRLSHSRLRKIAGSQFFFVMKLSFLVTFFAVLSVSANVSVMSQKVSLNFRNAELRDVFNSLREQTGYRIIYSFDRLRPDQIKVSIEVRDVQLADALDELLKGSRYTYTVKDQNVMIVPLEETNRQQVEQITITGRVVDENNDPLAGVTVAVTGTTYGAITDRDGRFALKMPQRAGIVLRFSFIGKKDVGVAYTGQTALAIRMEDAASEIEQVVVTGFQTIAREKVTGAVTTITAEDLGKRYTPNLMDNLEGRVAGLMVYNGGMQIRGTGSIHANRTPLLVVDGLPVEGSIDDLNPYDIENVTVLKDAAAAAIYGARASNGIIVVTTKRARHTDKLDIDVSANFTVFEKQNLNYHDNFYMNPAEQVAREMSTWQSYFFDDPATASTAISTTETGIAMGYYASSTPIHYAYYQLAKGIITRDQLNTLMEEYKGNNFAQEYSDKILRNRFLQQYNVAVRGRTDKLSSNLVFNYRRDNTGTINQFDNRFSSFYKGSYDITKWLTANYGAEIILQKGKENNSFYAKNPFNVPAYMRLLNDDGSYNYYSSGFSNIYHTQWKNEPGLLSNHFNHLEEIENGFDEKLTKRLSARMQGELQFNVIEGLTVKTQFVYEADRRNESTYSQAESYLMRMMRNGYTTKTAGVYTYLIPEHGGRLATVDTRGDYWTARGQVNFNRTFGKHTIDFLAGLEFRQTNYKGTNGLMLGYDDQLQSHSTFAVNYPALEKLTYSSFYGASYPVKQFFYVPYISEAISPVREQLHRYGSGYANLTYTYNNRYNLFGSFRSDYADVYGLDTKFRGKPLWSLGASWNIDREEFMGGAAWVDMLKLRASYGVTGNIYQGATSFLTATTGTINITTGQPISVVSSPANPELKWEQTATTNVGLDFGVLGNRLRGSVDWYYKKGTDIFAAKLLEDSKGFASMAMNAASMKNNGVEVVLAADWFRARHQSGFSWTTSTTFAYNKNEITEVDTPATTARQLIATPYKKGYPVSALFVLPYAGISADGIDYLYWSNGEAKTTIWNESPNVALFSGQTDPKVSIGMENRFRYRNFSLNIMMVYYGGHKMRMRQIGKGAKYALPYGTIDKAYLNSWTPDNTETNVPGYGQWGSNTTTSTEYQSLDIYVKSGDFLKIRNIVLGYDLPHAMLSKIGLGNASLRFQIDNPKALHIANGVGVDPETGGIRKQTSYIFGLNFSF